MRNKLIIAILLLLAAFGLFSFLREVGAGGLRAATAITGIVALWFFTMVEPPKDISGPKK